MLILSFLLIHLALRDLHMAQSANSHIEGSDFLRVRSLAFAGLAALCMAGLN